MRKNRDLKGGTPPGYPTEGTLSGVVPLYGLYWDEPNDGIWFCLPNTPGAPFQDFSLKHSVIFFSQSSEDYPGYQRFFSRAAGSTTKVSCLEPVRPHEKFKGLFYSRSKEKSLPLLKKHANMSSYLDQMSLVNGCILIRPIYAKEWNILEAGIKKFNSTLMFSILSM